MMSRLPRQPGLASLLLVLVLSGCATTRPDLWTADPRSEVGKASYYGRAFQGRTTASGQTYDHRRLTAAHRTLPFGTRVRVTNLKNGQSVVVTITDRGPFRKNRVIDVSERAARELGFYQAGLARVRIEVLRT